MRLFKSSSASASFIDLRHKRAVVDYEYRPSNPPFINAEKDFSNDSDYYEYDDDNYDVIPDMKSSGDDNYPPNVGDQISQKAKEVAESFTQMWQSLTDSVRHCLNAVRRLFSDDSDEQYDNGSGIQEQEEQKEQLRVAMEEYYQAKNMHDNEVLMNALEHN